jgi:putative heme-binding domain-containing protein
LEHASGQGRLLSAAIAAARQQGGPRMKEAITRLAGEKIPSDTLAAALETLGALRIAAAVPVLRARAVDGAPDVRITAVRALGQIGNNQAVEGLISGLNDPEVAVRREVLGALGSLRVKAVPEALLRAWLDPRTRLEAITALARVPDLRALDAYLDGLSAKSPGVRDDCRKALAAIRVPAWPLIREKLASDNLSPSVVSELKSLYGNDQSLAPWFDTARKALKVEEYAAFGLSGRGDPKRGRAIFDDSRGIGCTKCHRVNGAGGEGGPDLSHIASTYGRAELIESILSPSKKIADGYRLTVIALADGTIISGVVLDSTGETLTLVDNQGRKRAIRKSDIEKKTERDASSMPDGLQSGLSLQEFADVVAYLESLK